MPPPSPAVVDAGSHGTHVAGITAAHHPEDPALNGIAPGASLSRLRFMVVRLLMQPAATVWGPVHRRCAWP